MAAAANMTPEQRAQMIGGMVKQLAAKLEENPNDADGWLKIGRAYMVMGDPDKSADAYERAAKLKPGDVSVPLQEVEALLDNRTPEAPIPQRAIALLRKIEAANPKEPQALWLLGVSAAQADQPGEAVGYWTRLLAQLPAEGADATMVRGAIEAIKKK